MLLFAYMEIRILVSGLKVSLRRHNIIIIIILQAEQCAEAGRAPAEVLQGVFASAKCWKKLYRRIFSYIS